MKIKIHHLIFIHTCWVYTISNFLIAWISPLSFPIQVIRDSWFIYPLLLGVRKKSTELILYLYLFILGLILLVDSFSVKSFSLFLYSFRDFSLIILISQLLKYNLTYSSKQLYKVKRFVIFILACSGAILLLNFFLSDIIEAVFNTQQYFINKGVSSNLGFGLFGLRLIHPLYSPNLLGQLLFTTIFILPKLKFSTKSKIIAFVVSVFTLSKSIVLIIFFRIFKKSSIYLVLIGFGLIPIFQFYQDSILQIFENPVLRYHISSTIGHLNAFKSFNEFFEFLPKDYGSYSVLNNVLDGVEEAGIESTLISRLLELKFIFSIPLIIYIVNTFYSLEDNKKLIYGFFLILLTLTATANHPIYIIPIIYLLNAKYTHIPNITTKS